MEIAENAEQVVTQAATADLSIISLVMSSDLIGKSVVLTLLFASIWSWAIMGCFVSEAGQLWSIMGCFVSEAGQLWVASSAKQGNYGQLWVASSAKQGNYGQLL